MGNILNTKCTQKNTCTTLKIRNFKIKQRSVTNRCEEEAFKFLLITNRAPIDHCYE